MKMTLSSTTLKRYAYLIIPIAFLLKFAAIFVWTVHFDSNYYLNIGSNFIERGELTPFLWRIPSEANIIAGSGTGYGILLQTYWLQWFGLSLTSGRIFTYVTGGLALIPMYFTIRRLWDDKTALVTVIIASISTTFLVLLTMRMDAAGILGYSIVLLVHVYGVYSGRWWLHALAGILAIASAEIHILGTVYVFGLAFYYAVDFFRTWHQERQIPWQHGAWFYYGGAFIAGLAYIWFRILPNPEEYFLIPSLCPFCGSASIGREAIRYVVFFAFRPVEAVLLIFAVRSALARRQTQDTHYLILLSGCALAMGIISPLPLPIYTSHLWSVIMLGIGVAFTHGHGKTLQMPHWRLQAIGGIAAVALLTYAAYLTWLAVRPQAPDPRFAYIQEHIPTNAVIAGNDRYFHQLLEYPQYISNGEEFGLVIGTHIRGETGADLWARQQPRAILLDYDAATSVSEIEHVDALRAYITENDFVEVMPDLWIDPALAE